jgi:hypothetical protein
MCSQMVCGGGIALDHQRLSHRVSSGVFAGDLQRSPALGCRRDDAAQHHALARHLDLDAVPIHVVRREQRGADILLGELVRTRASQGSMDQLPRGPSFVAK